MGFYIADFKFFRLRTPANIEGYGVRADVFWLAKAIELIDFTFENLLYGTVFINQIIPSCFSYETLCNMEFDRYEKIIEIAREINNGKK
jgi:hypothetical protein